MSYILFVERQSKRIFIVFCYNAYTSYMFRKKKIKSERNSSIPQFFNQFLCDGLFFYIPLIRLWILAKFNLILLEPKRQIEHNTALFYAERSERTTFAIIA